VPCAERAPHSELLLARDATRQHKATYVATPYQEDTHTCAQQHEQRCSHRPHGDVLEPHDVDAPSGIRVGERALESERDRVELLLGGGNSHVGPEASHGTDVSAAAARPLGHWDDQVGRLECRKLEAAGEHAHNGMRDVVHDDRSRQDVRVARIAPRPEAMADERHGMVSALLLHGDPASEYRVHAKHGQQLVRRAKTSQRFRFAITREDERVLSIGSGATERAALLPGGEIEERCRVPRHAALRRRGEQHHESIGIRKREGAQHERVHDREDGGGHGNAEGERQDRHRREPGIAPHHSQGVARILPPALGAAPSPGFTCGLPNLH
jgi:hypothetical protein